VCAVELQEPKKLQKLVTPDGTEIHIYGARKPLKWP